MDSNRKESESLKASPRLGSRDDQSIRSNKYRDNEKPKEALKAQETRGKDPLVSPRRSGLSDEKKFASPRPATKITSRDDLFLDRKSELSKGPFQRTASPKFASQDRLETQAGMGEKGEKLGPKSRSNLGMKSDDTRNKEPVDENKDSRGKALLKPATPRDKPLPRKNVDSSAEAAASKHPSGFDFKQGPKHTLIKLRRPLPANLSGTRYDLVQLAAKHIGFVQTADDDFKTPFLIWTDSFISAERLTQLKLFQRVNHFPGMAEIARKDLLAKNLGKLAKLNPGEYNFSPRTWCLPGELAQFQQYTKELAKPDKKQLPKSYISKPVDGASGRGIRIYKTAEEVPATFEGDHVLQEYVSNPFLIENVKFDLRLYVLVTSCEPLRVYFFNEGFIRMSTEPYVDPCKCTTDDAMAFTHLTNSAVNRQNQATEPVNARRRTNIGSDNLGGNKRSLRFLNEYLQKANYDVALLWRNIMDLLVKTAFAACPHIVRSYRQCRPSDGPAAGSVCFEILGFDILLDANLKPWLLEVNRSPSFDSLVTAEREVKLELLEETLMLLSMNPSDRRRATTAPPRAAIFDATGSAKERKELADLAALLVRLRRQELLAEADGRLCQKFRRLFPSDDAARQERLTALLLSAFPVLLEVSGGPLQREAEAFYGNKLTAEQAAKQLASRGAAAFQQVGDAADSSSDEEATGGLLRDRAARGVTRRSATAKKPKKRKQEKQTLQVSAAESPSCESDQYDQMVARTLQFLNQLSIGFPGRSNREVERMLRGLQDAWAEQRSAVGAYWRLSLDGDKRRKLLGIADRSVRVALDRGFRVAGAASGSAASADGSSGARRLGRLFNKLYNRLLWSNGQGLWDSFSGRSDWEGVLRQIRSSPTEAELNCCQRVVQLCQDCLLVVYLYSHEAEKTRQQRQQQEKQQHHQQQPAPIVF